MSEEGPRLRRYTERSVWRKHKWELRALVVIAICSGLYYFFWPADESSNVVTDVGGAPVAQPDTLHRALAGKVPNGTFELSRIVGARTIGLRGYVELDFQVVPDTLVFRIPNLHRVDITFTRISDGSEVVMEQTEDEFDEEYKDVTWVGEIPEEDTLRVTLHPAGHTELTHALSTYNLDWIIVVVQGA